MIRNVEIYGLENAFRVSKFPMSVDVTNLDGSYTNRIELLGKSGKGEGHDNFLKGIIVQFDLSFTVKAWIEAERYHWFEIISSQSTMHRLWKMDFDRSFNSYVTDATRQEMDRLKAEYEWNPSEENMLALLYNCPTGLILTAGITTNYRQLKTIYAQRKHHKLPEWKVFCKWIETLPHADLIIG